MHAEDAIEVSLDIHTKSAIVRTCYALSDRATFELRDTQDKSKILVSFVRKDQNATLEDVKRVFADGLIDFSLREQIEDKTKTVRDAIVTAALVGLRGRS